MDDININVSEDDDSQEYNNFLFFEYTTVLWKKKDTEDFSIEDYELFQIIKKNNK
jgi:hypothetical protein